VTSGAGCPRRGLRATLFLAGVLLLSGCLKYDLTLLISEDDTLDGTLIVAVSKELAAGQDIFSQTGDLTPSEGSVAKEPYEDDDYIGTRYVISGVPISEMDSLSADDSTRFSLTREGDEYLLDASLNFNLGGTLGGSESLPSQGAFSALVSLTFPGAVLESNGTIDGNTVTWTELDPDVENNLSARASAISNGQAEAGAGGGTVPWWVWAMVGAGFLLVAGIVVVLVRRKRSVSRADAAALAPGQWPEQQQGGYNEFGVWVPSTVYGYDSGYYGSGQEQGYGYHGPRPDTSGDTYGGPPGTAPAPYAGYPQGGYPQGGGYPGHTVVP